MSLVLAVVGCGFNVDQSYLDPVVRASDPPPPIVGGTLLVTSDARFAVVADPDRDRLVVVDLERRDVTPIGLATDSEPGRIVEDQRGRLYVVLRRAGRVAELVPDPADVVREIEACESPQGIAHEPASDRLFVACADGTLVTLGPDRAVESRRIVAPDLRDVVVTSQSVLLTRHRSAEVLRLDLAGETLLGHHRLPIATLEGGPGLSQRYAPTVGVRLVSTPDGEGAVLLHQRSRIGREAVFVDEPVEVEAYTYSNRPVTNGTRTWNDPCGNAVVHVTATMVSAEGLPTQVSRPLRGGVSPVDLAISSDGGLAVAFAGDRNDGPAVGPQVSLAHVEDTMRGDDGGPCLEANRGTRFDGQVVGVAYARDRLVVQLREPAALVVDGEAIPLGGGSVRDTGHDMFHLDAGGGISCASCHPGGADDVHVWDFAATAPTRTLALEGTAAHAPYHRAGDVPSFDGLMGALSAQMEAPVYRPDQLGALRAWLIELPLAPRGAPDDPEAARRGERVFQDETVGCASCHQGELGTDNLTHRVGVGRWQTPPLRGVALRAPYLHDGSAGTLADVLRGAEDGGHGDVRGLTAAERADLLSYLASR